MQAGSASNVQTILDSVVLPSEGPMPIDKVYLLDLRINTARIVFGEPTFHGRALPDGVVTPQMIVEALHPDDMPQFLEAIERAATIADDGEIFLNLRAYQADGRLLRFCQRATPFERDSLGRVTVLRIECHAESEA